MDDSTLGFPILKQYLKYCYGELIYDEDIPCPESQQMMSDWGSLPLLALKNVLGYLNRHDALAAMSTCRHWRSALLMYEDSKATIKLRVNDIDRSLLVTRIFRKQCKRLIVYVNTYEEDQLDEFMNVVISLFYDTKLQELVFVGHSYLHQNPRALVPELSRSSVESAIIHLRNLKRFALLGCSLSSAKNKELYVRNNDMTKVQRIRKFKCDPSPHDTVLSRCNMDLMMYTMIQALILDYEYISTESLETLHELKLFRHLTMVVRDKPHFAPEPVDWLRLQALYTTPLNVTVCLLQLPNEKIEEVMDNVFVQGLQLVSLKAMFCKTMHMGAIIQVSKMYMSTLQEFVWTDAPYDATRASQRLLRTVKVPELNMCNVNPLVLMCWQCARLKRFVVHGYWIWHYDVLGMARLRRGMHLELSSVSAPHARASRYRAGVARVLSLDRDPRARGDSAAQLLSENEEMSNWIPVPWSRLHPGLRAGASREQRADYVLLETRTPFGVTYPYKNWRRRYYDYLDPTSTHM